MQGTWENGEFVLASTKQNEIDRLNYENNALRVERNRMQSALEKISTSESSGHWGTDLGCIRAIARIGLDPANVKGQTPP